MTIRKIVSTAAAIDLVPILVVALFCAAAQAQTTQPSTASGDTIAVGGGLMGAVWLAIQIWDRYAKQQTQTCSGLQSSDCRYQHDALAQQLTSLNSAMEKLAAAMTRSEELQAQRHIDLMTNR